MRCSAKSPAVSPIELPLSRLADGTYLVLATDGEVESEPVIIMVQGGKTADGRIEFRLPLPKPKLLMR